MTGPERTWAKYLFAFWAVVIPNHADDVDWRTADAGALWDKYPGRSEWPDHIPPASPGIARTWLIRWAADGGTIEPNDWARGRTRRGSKVKPRKAATR